MKTIGFFFQGGEFGDFVRMNAVKNYLTNLDFEVKFFNLQWVKGNYSILNFNNVGTILKKVIQKEKFSLSNELIWNSRTRELQRLLKEIPQKYSVAMKGIDILHAEAAFAGLVCAELKKSFGVPFIVDIHSIPALEQSGDKRSKKWINLWQKSERDILKTADVIIAVNEYMKQYIIEKCDCFGSKIFIIPNGADLLTNKAKYSLPLNIIYGGNFTYYESVLDFVKTAEILSGDNYNFILMGDGPQRGEILNYINRNHVNIIYVGKKTRQEALKRFCGAQVGIIPGLKSVRSQAASSVKLMEYASCGLPVITVDISNWGEIVRKYDCGIVTRNSNPEEFAEAIRQMGNKERWDKKSENAMRMIQEAYCWDKVLEPISDIYKSF